MALISFLWHVKIMFSMYLSIFLVFFQLAQAFPFVHILLHDFSCKPVVVVCYDCHLLFGFISVDELIETAGEEEIGFAIE